MYPPPNPLLRGKTQKFEIYLKLKIGFELLPPSEGDRGGGKLKLQNNNS
jgi:hypothetical protein